MDIEVYSKCRIQYVPNDHQRPNREYSDKSQLQLLYYAENSYSLTGIDVANNNSVCSISLDIPFTFSHEFHCRKSSIFL